MALFDEIPLLKGKGFDYSHMFSIVFALVLGLTGLAVMGGVALVGGVVRVLKHMQNKQCDPLSRRAPGEPLLKLDESQRTTQSERLIIDERRYHQYGRAIAVVQTLSQALKWFALWLMAFATSFASGVDCLPFGVAMTICILLSLAKFLWQTQCWLSPEHQTLLKEKYIAKSTHFTTSRRALFRLQLWAERQWMIFLEQKTKYLVLLVLSLTVFITTVFFFENSCLTPYNQPIGITLPYEAVDLSTRLTRSINQNKKCPPGPPCHVYPTLPYDANTQVIINIHTHEDIGIVLVQLAPKDQYQETATFTKSVSSQDQMTPIRIEPIADRNVHQVLVKDLQPNTTYTIGISYPPSSEVVATYHYRTFDPTPPEGTKLTFLAGGDVSTSDAAHQMTHSLLPYRPSAILLGGDISYDDGQVSCYHTYDAYLDMMSLFSAVNGNVLVPVIYAVGNHDLGLNNDPGAHYPTGDLTPLYVQYFPQGITSDTVPSRENRVMHHVVQFSNIMVYSLDVGYDSRVQGKQHFWLEQHMQNHPDKLKFAQYHDPTYTSCKREDEDVFHNLETVLQWNPVFDRHRLMAAFENHAHLFKFSRKLKGNQVHPNGTLYLGDGCWGAEINNCKLNTDYEVFQAVDRKYNCYVVEVEQGKSVTYTAIDEQGNVLLRDSQLIRNYVG